MSELHRHEYDNKIGGYPDEPNDLAEWSCECGSIRGSICVNHDPNSGPGSDWCPNCGEYADESVGESGR